MKLSLQTFWLLLWCWINEVSIKQAMKLSGLSKPTIRRWYQKFRLQLPDEKLDNLTLSGIIQMDEAYGGGKAHGYSIIGAKEQCQKNSQKNSQRRNRKSKIAFRVIPKPSVDRRDVISFMSQHIEPDSKLRTDGNAIYRGINNWWSLGHEYERHNRWEFALTSEIEGIWRNLTKFIRKVYDHVTQDKIPDILREFVARRIYPKWFEGPNTYLSIGLDSLTRPVPKKWRGKHQKRN